MLHARECIGFRLPPLKATAGVVLQHAVRVVETLFQKHDPMIFKFGYTHNPIFRWENPVYGYSFARDKWSNMYVVYIADEAYSPAMLEAALIEKYQSILSVKLGLFSCLVSHLLTVLMHET